MTMSNAIPARFRGKLGCAVFGFSLAAAAGGAALAQSSLPNACPVDGCEVKIASVSKAGNELAVTFEANFMPDLSKNHIHIWWGETYTVEQVSNNAEPTYGVKQGDWHPTDDFPAYTTQSAASLSVRNGARTLCVTAADRNHDILNAKVYHCMDVGDHL
ncbi:hypothetical protein [Pelagibius sp.]|uniref:hypothetical protein n=1 Tax=Pelagibius sp. TaxID=1931238 RepID=UPI002601F256|nr:hypothetical protein [Pelagibius sp.]